MSLSIKEIRIEYRDKPVGMGEKKPRFSWKLPSEWGDVFQSAYRLRVRGGEVNYDTGKVKSRKSHLIEYKGTPLAPETHYDVFLDVWDNRGNKAHGQTYFETGLLDGFVKETQFIAPATSESLSCSEIFTEITIEKPVVRARAYATALGMYELYVNRQKADDLCFAPYWTDYRHTLEYQTYDIAPLLWEGKNEVCLRLAKGWYRSELNGKRDNYGTESAGLAELHVDFAGGERFVLSTNETWRSRRCFIADSEIYHGETQDFTADLSAEYPVKEIQYDKSRVVAQMSEPCRVTQRIKPVCLIKTPKGEQVLDFGQNLVGVVEFRIQGERGQKVMLRHAEVLDKEGNFYTENLRTARAEDVYILDGTEQTLHSRFTWHGFRYVQIIGAEANVEDFTALVIHSDLTPAGMFTCSDERVNRLAENIRWSQRGNFVDVPTDCPQRDERLGWTGDANVFAPTAAFNYDVALFFRKWLNDLRAGQADDGSIPATVPSLNGSIAAAMWSDSAAMIPWEMYLAYGDTRFLADSFDSICRYADKLQSMCGEGGLIRSGHQFGDWLAPDREECGYTKSGATDMYFIANVFYLRVLEIARDAADILSFTEKRKEFAARRRALLSRIRREYFTVTGRMVCETQTACVLALHFDVAPARFRSKIAHTLRENVERHRGKLATGFIGTPYLCFALADNGMYDLAEKVLMDDTCPGWLYEVKMGATTVWERWNGISMDGELYDPEMNSFNHYAYGSIGSFLFRRVAGIERLAPGYARIRINPHLTAGIEEASAEFECPYGTIRAGYCVRGGVVAITAELPPNTAGEVVLPSGTVHAVGNGKFRFEEKTDADLKPHRFDMDSKVGDVLDDERAFRAAREIAPEIFGGASEMIRPMTFRRAASYGGEEMAVKMREILRYINEAIEKQQ